MFTKHLNEVEFTIFDTETTGLDPESGDRIIEIAAMRFKADTILATFESFINPHRLVSQAAFAVNNISPLMLRDAPESNAVLPQFLEFIKGSCICSYNAGFDLGFLNNELTLLGLGTTEEMLVVDVLKMARRLLPGLDRYALWFVADKLGIPDKQAHRAMADVELTRAVFFHLKNSMLTKGITDFANFFNLFSIDAKRLADLNQLKIAKIQEALDLGVALKIKYIASVNATVSERVVVPKQIRRERGSNYLVGHCQLRNEERSFKIDNMLHVEIV